MISYQKAQSLILRHTRQSPAETVPLLASLGSVLAETVKADFSLPHFDNSAMDGFVFRSVDTALANPQNPVSLEIIGLICAGQSEVLLKPNQAYRIMTGAPIPKGADTVQAQEQSEIVGKKLIFKKPFPAKKNVRFCGEELKKNQTVLKAGTALNSAVIGILASLGRNEVKVFQKPKISILVTGSELLSPGLPLQPGKIYDSNSAMLYACLTQMGNRPLFVRKVEDSFPTIKKILRYALGESDVVILAGGVSTGETDYVKPALKDLGVKTIFWGVNQKPGKPIYFGTKEDKIVFGLPGNPAAVFTCFYEYVYPAIRHRMRYPDPFLASRIVPAKEAILSDPSKHLFLKAQAQRVLPSQASHMISSLALATEFLVVEPSSSVQAGDPVLVHTLP